MKDFRVDEPIKRNCISKFIHLLDIIGTKPKMKVGTDSRHTSLLGGILCFFLYILMFMGLLYFGRDLVEKNDPITSMSTDYDVTPRRFNLTNDVFDFWVGLEDSSYDYYIDPTIYNIHTTLAIKLTTVDKDGTLKFDYSTSRTLEMIRCNESESIQQIFN